MKLNAIERAAMNNPLRAAHQHHREAAWFGRLAGGSLSGQHVLEVGCGRGVGVEVLLDRLDAAPVTAFDLDPAMVENAERRLHNCGAAVELSIGDACEIEQPSASVDAVVEFAAFGLDPAMIGKAERRLHARRDAVSLSVADACEIELPSASIDAVVEFGVIHQVPDWRTAIAEIARVLRPGGLLLFEDVPRHTLDTWLFRTFTVHPRQDRFEAEEFADELARHGLSPTAAPERHFGGHAFAGAARKAR